MGTNTQLVNFGLNMLYTGSPGISGASTDLNYFFPTGTFGLGYNPLFAEWDFNLATNEVDLSGNPTSAAWDLQFNKWVTFRPIQFSGSGNLEADITHVVGDVPVGQPNPTVYLDASGANALIPGSWNDFLGGASILFVDFVSRLDPSGNYSSNTSNVYEVDVTPHYQQVQVVTSGSSTTITTVVSINGMRTTTVTDGNGHITSGPTTAPAPGDPATITNHIAASDYTNYYSSTPPTYASQHFGNDFNTELANIKEFPNSSDPGNPTSQQYSIFRVPVSSFQPLGPPGTTISGGTTTTINTATIPAIDFSLKCDVNSSGIFVRGVRIRSDWADELFRGAFDNSSTAGGNTLPPASMTENDGTVTSKGLEGSSDGTCCFQHLYSQAGSSWKSTLGFNVGNECNWPFIRCFAYINEKFRTWSKKHGGVQKDLFSFITSSQNWWRSIYVDQSNGDPPPPLQNESIEYGNNGYFWQTPRPDHDYGTGNLLFAGDAISSAIKNHTTSGVRDFIELGRSITGWNNSNISKNCPFNSSGSYANTQLSGGTNGNGTPNDGNDYATYTTNIQSALNGISSGNKNCAINSYPQDKSPSAWVPFWSYPSTFDATPDWVGHPDNPWDCFWFWGTTLSEVQQNYATSSIPGNIMTALRAGLLNNKWSWNTMLPYSTLTAGLGSSDLCLVRNALWSIVHPNTPAEIREDTWDAITWGAKGILYNPIGSDGSGDIGFCGNNWEDNFNSGFSSLSEQPSEPHPDWAPKTIYSVGDWITVESVPPTYYFCIASTQNIGDNVSEPGTGSNWTNYWESNSSYGYYGAVCLTFGTGYIIPPATPGNNDPSRTFPDHLIIRPPFGSGEDREWVPCLSDFDIYSGPNQQLPKLLAMGSPVTSLDIANYLTGVQNYAQGWSVPKSSLTAAQVNALVTYYSQYQSTQSNKEWVPSALGWGQAQHPDDNSDGTFALGNHVLVPGDPLGDKPNQTPYPIIYSDWVAGDRTIVPMPGSNPYAYTPVYFYPYAHNGTAGEFAITGVPTYYGLKDRSDGVKRAMADLAPIAQELKNLHWLTSYDYADYASGTVAINNKTTLTSNQIWATGLQSDGVTLNTDGSHQTGDPEFPLAVDASYQVQQSYQYNTNYSTTYPFTKASTDDGTTWPLYYNIGVFHDPNDAADPSDAGSSAIYATIANRRTWPINYNYNSDGSIASIQKYDPTAQNNSLEYLGAIDARIVDLKLKPKWDLWNSSQPNNPWSSYQYYTITNLRTGKSILDKIASPTDYELTLGPGEGTLLRIAPATSVELGRTPYAGMAYNNGHRICDISGPCNSHEHGVVWEDNGKIMFCRVTNEADVSNDPISTFLAKINSDTSIYQVKTVYDPGGDHKKDGHNPSIAAKGDTVAIVYSIDDFTENTNNIARSVRFTMSDGADDYSASNWTANTKTLPLPGVNPPPLGYITPLVKDITGNVPGTTTSFNLLTPAVTPSVDGFVAAYTDANIGIVLYLIRTSDMSRNFIPFTPGPLAPKQYRMVSLASRAYLGTDPWIDPNAELIDVAWEQDNVDGTSDILYEPLYHVQGKTDPSGWHAGSATIISNACVPNRHPMVAALGAAGNGTPVVTWETGGLTIFRQMTGWSPMTWSSFWGFLPTAVKGNSWEFQNLPLPQIRSENALCSISEYVAPFKNAELIYQDTFNHFERIARNQGLFTTNWNNSTKLKEYAQFGSVSMPYGNFSAPFPPANPTPNGDGSIDPGVLSFRGIWADENNEYAAKIVTSPPAEMSLTTNVVQKFDMLSGNIDCIPSAQALSLGPPLTPPPSQTQPSDSGGITWNDNPIGIYQQTPLNDSESDLTPTGWPITQDSVRTNYFAASSPVNLNMIRVLTVDSTTIDSLLPDASHWLSYKLVVKDSASQEVTQVLDSALITYYGPQGRSNEPGINPNDTSVMGQGFHIWGPVLPTQSGTAYITVLLTKDSSTQASLVQEQLYCDSLEIPDPIDTSSSDSGAFKRSQPNTGASSAPQQELTVTVHPNPVRGSLKICVEDLPAQIPVSVDVVNELGTQVAMLYNATPEAELGLCLSLDCTNLPAGIYYADLQTQGQHKAVQFTVEH